MLIRLWSWLRAHTSVVASIIAVAVVEAIRAILARRTPVATPPPVPEIDLSKVATGQSLSAKDYDKLAAPYAVTIEAEHDAIEVVTAKQAPDETATDKEVSKWLSERLK